MSIKDGGPLHPTVQQIDGNGEVVMYAYCGASLRDYFAGLAMQGMIACGEEYDNAELGRFAYDVADAMIRAREAVQ